MGSRKGIRWDEEGQAIAEQALLTAFLVFAAAAGTALMSEMLMPALQTYMKLLSVTLALPWG